MRLAGLFLGITFSCHLALAAVLPKDISKATRCYAVVVGDNGIGLGISNLEIAHERSARFFQVPVPGKGAYLFADTGTGVYFFQSLSSPASPLGTDKSIYDDIRLKFGSVPKSFCLKLAPPGITVLYEPERSRLAEDLSHSCRPEQTYQMEATAVETLEGVAPSYSEMKKLMNLKFTELAQNESSRKRLNRTCLRRQGEIVYLYKPKPGTTCAASALPAHPEKLSLAQALALPKSAEEFRNACYQQGDTPGLNAKMKKISYHACRMAYGLKKAGVLPANQPLPANCAPKRPSAKADTFERF